MHSKHHAAISFFLLTLALIFVVFLTPLFQKGMHADGVLYATMARNMADGLGSIWSPHNTNTLFPHFFEHPPLGLWLESLYFHMFGNSFLTERLFCLTEAIILSTGVVVFWKRVFNSRKFNHLVWVPIFICFSNFLIIKDMPRNFLDTTVMCFSLWAAIFITRDNASFLKNRVITLGLGSLLMFLGFLSNGFQAFFPLMIPLFDCLVRRKISWKFSICEVIFMLLLLIIMFLLLFYLQPASIVNIKNYIFTQVLPSTVGTRSDISTMGWGRAYILIFPLFDSTVGLLLLALFYIFSINSSDVSNNKSVVQNATLFLLIALSASLPIVLAHRQSASYILQSMPFYVLSLSVLLTPCFATLIVRINNLDYRLDYLLYYISLILLFIAITLFSLKFGTPRRDKILLNNINKINYYLGNKDKLSASNKIRTDYKIGQYFSRKFRIFLTYNNAGKYYLANCTEHKLKNYNLIDLGTQQLCLYSQIEK